MEVARDLGGIEQQEAEVPLQLLGQHPPKNLVQVAEHLWALQVITDAAHQQFTAMNLKILHAEPACRHFTSWFLQSLLASVSLQSHLELDIFGEVLSQVSGRQMLSILKGSAQTNSYCIELQT